MSHFFGLTGESRRVMRFGYKRVPPVIKSPLITLASHARTLVDQHLVDGLGSGCVYIDVV